MKLKKLLSIGIVSMMALSLFAIEGQAEEANTEGQTGADKVVYSNFYTEEGGSEAIKAVVIDDGKITYAGSEEAAEEYIGSDTIVIDYKDKYALPGFIDGHTHSYVSAENTISDFDVTDCSNAEECIKKISDFIKNNPKDFYIGCGWLDAMFEGGMPKAELLDAIDTDAPIYLKSEDCHSAWTNTAMMKLCDITAETKDPIGGVVEHLENGEPAGCFRDTAMDLLIKPHVPVYSVEQYKEILQKSMESYISLGYTAYNDVLIDITSADNIIQAYHELDEEGLLTAYVNITYLVNNDDKIFDNIQHIKELSDETAGEHFKVSGVKFFMDGITESCTSYMLEPYLSNPDSYGVDRWAGEENTQRLYDAATLCNDLDLIAHFHGIGDAAVRKGLDAMEYAKEHSKNPEIRNAMTHIQYIADEDISRFAELGAIASCDPGWCYADNAEMNNDPSYKNIEFTNLGEERTLSAMSYNSILKSGGIVAFATDFPATPTVNPFECLEYGATRYYHNVKSTICNPDEAMDIKDELKSITENTAYQLYQEDLFGTIETGKAANFIIVDRDITAIDKATISEAVLEATYIDGNSVYTK